VCLQVGNGALAGDDGLDEEAEHGEQRQAAVLDLLHLGLVKTKLAAAFTLCSTAMPIGAIAKNAKCTFQLTIGDAKRPDIQL